MPLRPILLAGSAFLAAVHAFGVLAGAPVLPWAAVAAFGLLVIHAGAEPRNRPLLAALAVLTVHALMTMPEKVNLSGQYFWTATSATGHEPDLIDEIAWRDYREAGLMLLVVTLLLVASLGGGAVPTRGALLGGGAAMVIVVGYPVVRIADTANRIAAEAALGRTDQSPWSTGAALSVLAAVPVAAGLVAVLGAVVGVRRPWVVAGAVLLVLGAVLRIDYGLRSVLLPYQVAIHNPFAAWDGLTSSAVVPGLVAGLRTGLEFAGIILIAAGLSHRAAGGRVGQG
ncbi:hypothetical protein [Actinoplanes sp. NPDC049316]|uniref:hypothetical protein n=1 Tax=Actinoplanes sp. NPDC049316 TaxID=3154727 RepID=UPI00341EE70F